MSETPEQEARRTIDAQLAAAGWAVQNLERTATPSKATLGFFDRKLVTEPSGARQTARTGSPKGQRERADQYPDVQAVADGVNVGYDIYRIKIEVSENGVTVKAWHDYQKRDRLTRSKRREIREAEETFQKTQLDRSVVVPDQWSGATWTTRKGCPQGERGGAHQIRTVIRTFRERLFTEIFTDRPARAKAMGLDEPWVPKTLIFAKDDSHAEDIVDIVRKEFGKGYDFCKKVTYKAGAKSEDIIKAFRTVSAAHAVTGRIKVA